MLNKIIILFKYCADVENCGNFRGFSYIYIYIYIERERERDSLLIKF